MKYYIIWSLVLRSVNQWKVLLLSHACKKIPPTFPLCLQIDNKKHIDASVKERPQTLLVPSEEIYKRVFCNKHI